MGVALPPEDPAPGTSQTAFISKAVNELGGIYGSVLVLKEIPLIPLPFFADFTPAACARVAGGLFPVLACYGLNSFEFPGS